MVDVQENRSRLASPTSGGHRTVITRLDRRGGAGATRWSRARRRSGFSLIDLCVVVGLLALLAGVLVPTMRGELDRSKRSNALADVHRIAVAVDRYLNDMAHPPDQRDGKHLGYLHTAGEPPESNPFARGVGAPVDEFLITPLDDNDAWNGPYLGQSPTDPWGRQYIVNIHGFHSDKQRVWILSAGENGVIETMPTDSTPTADDIGMYIR